MLIRSSWPLPAVAIGALISAVTPAKAISLQEGWAAYERGDYALALQVIRPLAEQGDPEVEYKLGYMYQKGQGVAQDYAEAVKWYRRSAEKGQPFAQNNLGVMYKNGWGVPTDNVQAYFWFSLAITHYFEFEEMNLERAIQNRRSVAAKMTPEQISTAQKLAKDWSPVPYTPHKIQKLTTR